jgi:D-galactonate transporter
MAFLGTAINYIDRANLGVAEFWIRDELHLTKAQMGFVLSGFFWAYAFSQLPGGWIVDRLGARLTYVGSCLWWSLFTALTALGRGFTSLLSCRLLLGMGEAGAYPSNAKATAEWFPRNERALASSIFDSGSRIGTAASLPIVSYIIARYGWRWSFAATAILGVLWAFAWLLFYRRPDEHPWANEEERRYIREGGARQLDEKGSREAQQKLKWRGLFAYRTVWGMAIGFFCLSFVIYFFITWFPTYLREARHFSTADVGTWGALPPLIATFGGWIGGFASDRLARNGWSLTVARKVPIVIGMALSSVIGLAAHASTDMEVLAWLSLSYAGLACAAAGVWALPGDVAPTPAHVGSLSGIQNFASNLAGGILPPLVGILLDRTGNNYVIPLVLAGGAGLVGALVYWFIVGPIEPLPLREVSG